LILLGFGLVGDQQFPDRRLPPSVDDWLPERHLARFVVEVQAFAVGHCHWKRAGNSSELEI
jgi:hypothetical protein